MPQRFTSAPVRGAFAGGGDGAEFDAHLARQPLHPLPGWHARHDALDAARIHHGKRPGPQVAHREGRHLRFRIGAAHAVGVHHRQAKMGGSHQRLDGIVAADLQAHHRAEAAADELLHQRHRPRDVGGIRQAFLPHKRRAHVGDHRHHVIIGQILGRHQPYARAFGIQPAHIQQAKIGRTTAARAEDPGADRQRLDVLEREFAHHTSGRREAAARAATATDSRTGQDRAASTARLSARV